MVSYRRIHFILNQRINIVSIALSCYMWISLFGELDHLSLMAYSLAYLVRNPFNVLPTFSFLIENLKGCIDLIDSVCVCFGG